MQKPDTIDFAKLLGFDTVTHDLSEDVEFQNETLGAKLGAKVGDVIEAVAPGRSLKISQTAIGMGIGWASGSGDGTLASLPVSCLRAADRAAWMGGTNVSPCLPEDPSLPMSSRDLSRKWRRSRSMPMPSRRALPASVCRSSPIGSRVMPVRSQGCMPRSSGRGSAAQTSATSSRSPAIRRFCPTTS